MQTDRVGDFIVRLQNAARINAREVSTTYSAHVEAIARKLKQLGFLTSVEVKEKEGDEIKKTLVVELSYATNGRARLRGVKRVSKPSRRLYAPYTTSHRVKGGTGARILSTSSGILSDAEARKAHVGGEELFEIW